MAKVPCLDKGVIQAGDAGTARVATAAGSCGSTCSVVTSNRRLSAYRTAWIGEACHIPESKVIVRRTTRVNNEPQSPPLLNGKDKPDGFMLPAKEAGACAAGQLLSISKVGDGGGKVVNCLTDADGTGAVGGGIRERLWYAWRPWGWRRTYTQLFHPNVCTIYLGPAGSYPYQNKHDPVSPELLHKCKNK